MTSHLVGYCYADTFDIWVNFCDGYDDGSNFLSPGAASCSVDVGSLDVNAAPAPPAPSVVSVTPSVIMPGSSGSITINGSGFTGANVQIQGTGVNQTGLSVTEGRIVVDYAADQGASPGPRTISIVTPGGSTTTSVTVAPAMKLELVSFDISTDGNYTEDSTIRVTAVDAGTGATDTAFTGTVNIGEDTAIPKYVEIYSQNADSGACLVYVAGIGCSSSVTISSGGTATFLARSLAGPKVEGESGPDPAQLTVTNYPVYRGADLEVPQWIRPTGEEPPFPQIDPLAMAQTISWLQARIYDIRTKAVGDLATVLGTVSWYNDEAIPGGVVAANYGSWGTATSPVTINPYYKYFRLDSASGSVCGLPGAAHALTAGYYHEARHGYQFSLMSATNDEDHDKLVNDIPIEPNDIFKDTADLRPVCDEFNNLPSQMRFKGKNSPDDYGSTYPPTMPGVGFAIEMDAHKFASQH